MNDLKTSSMNQWNNMQYKRKSVQLNTGSLEIISQVSRDKDERHGVKQRRWRVAVTCLYHLKSSPKEVMHGRQQEANGKF